MSAISEQQEALRRAWNRRGRYSSLRKSYFNLSILTTLILWTGASFTFGFAETGSLWNNIAVVMISATFIILGWLFAPPAIEGIQRLYRWTVLPGIRNYHSEDIDSVFWVMHKIGIKRRLRYIKNDPTRINSYVNTGNDVYLSSKLPPEVYLSGEKSLETSRLLSAMVLVAEDHVETHLHINRMLDRGITDPQTIQGLLQEGQHAPAAISEGAL